MKKIVLYLLILLTGATVAWSCNEDDPSGTSIFVDEDESTKNHFDYWLEDNFRSVYNIKFIYKYVDTESNLSYNLVPAGFKESQQLAALLKLLWLEPYEILQGRDFLRMYSPKIFAVIGCAAYNDGTITLGTAEGGMKITLYVGNWLKEFLYPVSEEHIADLNLYFFKTMHHEFAHVLHQTKNYPVEFNNLSRENYSPGSWQDRSDEKAQQMGFVSAYASAETQEDFVETLAVYVVSSDAEWTEILDTAATGTQGDKTGKELILEKLQYVTDYLKKEWDLDINELRDLVRERYDLLYTLNMDDPLNWTY